jgi:acyl-CoA thioesterase
MDPKVKDAIMNAAHQEPFARLLGIELLELEDGYSRVGMVYDPSRQDNIYARAHGGVLFGLIDEAFETAGQTDGSVAVALNVNVTYIASPEPGDRLHAEARRVAQTKGPRTTTSKSPTQRPPHRRLQALATARANRSLSLNPSGCVQRPSEIRISKPETNPDPEKPSYALVQDPGIVLEPFLDALADLVGAAEFRPEFLVFRLPIRAEALVEIVAQLIEQKLPGRLIPLEASQQIVHSTSSSATSLWADRRWRPCGWSP